MSTKQPENKYPFTCIYAGRRLRYDGKVYQLFLRDGKEEMGFSGVKGVWIGYTYRCGEDKIATKPERTDAERVDNPEWDAKDALVDAHRAEKRAKAKLADATRPALKNAITALVPLVRNIPGFQARHLVEYLVDEAKKASKKK